jgi:hypothetical protein
MKRRKKKGHRRKMRCDRDAACELGASDVNPVVQAPQGQACKPSDRRPQMLCMGVQVIQLIGVNGRIRHRAATERPKATAYLGLTADSVDALANLVK